MRWLHRDKGVPKEITRNNLKRLLGIEIVNYKEFRREHYGENHEPKGYALEDYAGENSLIYTAKVGALS